MILILTGPSGVGKTDTSWALLQLFKNIVFLDCDWFASRKPFSWEDETDVESVFQALSLMIGFYIKSGEKNFVVPITLQMAAAYEKYAHYFVELQLPIKTFRLRCSNQELARRIHERTRIDWQKQEELTGLAITQKSFDILFPNNESFYLIDTTYLTEFEVAEHLFKQTELHQ